MKATSDCLAQCHEVSAVVTTEAFEKVGVAPSERLGTDSGIGGNARLATALDGSLVTFFLGGHCLIYIASSRGGRSVFWGPLGITIIRRLSNPTLVTLVIAPVMYSDFDFWFFFFFSGQFIFRPQRDKESRPPRSKKMVLTHRWLFRKGNGRGFHPVCCRGCYLSTYWSNQRS